MVINIFKRAKDVFDIEANSILALKPRVGKGFKSTLDLIKKIRGSGGRWR